MWSPGHQPQSRKSGRPFCNKRLIDAAYAALGLMVVFVVTGCVAEHQEGNSQVFTFAPWIQISVLIIGVVCLMTFFLPIPSSVPFDVKYGPTLFGIVITGMFVPSLFMERAIVDETGLSIRRGIWVSKEIDKIELDDYWRIRCIRQVKIGGRAGRQYVYVLFCEKENGEIKKVKINGVVFKAAMRRFLEKAAQRGITIVEETSDQEPVSN